ncbi:MAG: hypothetical protein Ct9H90mP20_5620 [Candidatus Neomarinimicrobiota bacterium]|nr:MAG: hypothetical protein Ct9H90mP20_5620 [Candidatus Neomarinimicrobiota bacterium]
MFDKLWGDSFYPWLAFQSILDLTNKGEFKKGAQKKIVLSTERGKNKGLLKIISKIGISTISSYRGSQLHEIVGLGRGCRKCFTGTLEDWRQKLWSIKQQETDLFSYAKSNLTHINPGGSQNLFRGEYHTYNPSVVEASKKQLSYL